MKKISFLPFLLATVQILAQSKENERFALGFFTGMEIQSLGVQPLGNHRPEDLTAGAGRPKTGASVGIFAQKQISRWLHFQPELAISYIENQVIFWPDGPKTYRFLDAELPLHFVVSDWRRNHSPLRGCVIFGGRIGWNFAQNASNLLKVSQERFGLDLGLGAEIKLKRWRLQPAFVYSHGLNDLHFLEHAKYDEVVGKMVRDKLALRLLVWKLKK
ncbi:MAG: outer membrane beta-barrel protein [Phycisphaerae bacterium]|nr:outer membrane beta-barrel protein [Saprospiraceae bacterium]